MPTYIFRHGKLVDKAAYLETPWHRSDFPCPTVRGDIEEYRSPIDGRLITSRSERREDLKANGCIEWEPGINQSASKGLRSTGEKRTPGWSRKHQRPIKDGLLA